MKIYTYDNKVMTVGGKWMEQPPDPYNPLDLPPFTIRLKYWDNVTPDFEFGTGVQVSSSPNIWDLTYESQDWSHLLWGQSDLIEVIDANTSGVTNMDNMFCICWNLTSVPLFDTSNVTNMARMFGSCDSLTTVPLFDTSNVTNMARMFVDCGSLTTVPLFNTSKVTNMDSMFGGCDSLTTVPLFDTSNVTNMAAMFVDCGSLTTVPLFNTSKVTSMYNMCISCESLTSIPLLNTSSCTNMSYAFYACYNVQSGALALYQQASTQATPPSIYSGAFENCGSNTTTGAAELAQIPSDWK